MGREVRRVPLDFDHPIGEIWPGFQRDCGDEDCDGCPDCEKQDPPTGDGWQSWETVSEGSPRSPVFASRDAFVEWLSKEEDCSPVAADKFVEQGWAPSMMATPFGVFMGVQIAAGEAVAIEWQHVKAGDYTTVAAGSRIRHTEYDVMGRVNHRFPPPNGDYYFVTWDRGLPSLLEKNPGEDPDAPMHAGCRRDGFEILDEPAGAGGEQ